MIKKISSLLVIFFIAMQFAFAQQNIVSLNAAEASTPSIKIFMAILQSIWAIVFMMVFMWANE